MLTGQVTPTPILVPDTSIWTTVGDHFSDPIFLTQITVVAAVIAAAGTLYVIKMMLAARPAHISFLVDKWRAYQHPEPQGGFVIQIHLAVQSVMGGHTVRYPMWYRLNGHWWNQRLPVEWGRYNQPFDSTRAHDVTILIPELSGDRCTIELWVELTDGTKAYKRAQLPVTRL